MQNNNLRAVTVYAVTSEGRLKKLGRVGSAETEAIDVPISLLQDGSKLQLKVFHPTGSGGRLVSSLSIENPGIKTSAFMVESGAVIGLWIDADLSASLVFLQ